MASRTLRWTPEADEDLEKILAFYLERNGNSKYGDMLVKRFRKVLNNVVFSPYLGQRRGKRGLRYVIVKPFQLFYRVTKTEIIVTAVWDGRRDTKTLKLYR